MRKLLICVLILSTLLLAAGCGDQTDPAAVTTAQPQNEVTPAATSAETVPTGEAPTAEPTAEPTSEPTAEPTEPAVSVGEDTPKDWNGIHPIG